MRINEDFLDVEQIDDVVGNGNAHVDAEQTYRFVMNIGLHTSMRVNELLPSYYNVEKRLHKLGVENFCCDGKVYKLQFMKPTGVAMSPYELQSAQDGYIRVEFNQFTNLRHFILFMYYMMNLVQVPNVGNTFRHWLLTDTERNKEYSMKDIPQLFVLGLGDKVKYIQETRAIRFAVDCAAA